MTPIMNRYVKNKTKAVWDSGALSVPSFWLCSFCRFVNMRRKNVIVIIACLFAYAVNKCILSCCSSNQSVISLFFHCYFNDVACGLLFPAYCNLLLESRYACFDRLWKIELLLFCCGIFWEYAAPLFISYSISDPWDIIAYMSGGLIYWLMFFHGQRTKSFHNSRSIGNV